MEKIRKRVFSVIQIGNKTDALSRGFDYFISIMILLSVSVTFMLTFEQLEYLKSALGYIEFGTIIVFVIEYILRLWTAKYLYNEEKPFWSAMRFVVSFYGIVDLLTICSYFVPFLFSNGIVALRMLRVVRIMRLFKLNASYDAFNVITDVLKEKFNQIISCVFMIFILILMSSLCMYSLEHDAQPENFSNAFSGIWWSVSTMLTVGYGDIYPITIGGKIMAIIISFLGVGIVAIPTGIISAGFVEYYTKIKTGAFSDTDADFLVMEISSEHSFCKKNVMEIVLPEGLYIAALIRDEDVFIPNENIIIMPGDILMIASTSGKNMDASIEEVNISQNHSWIGKRIKDLDISRQLYILMIKRNGVSIKPSVTFVLQQDDRLIFLDKRNVK